ncbi:non-ribosomal peptide synthetase [Actinophytocola oryzae]|uniref:Phenyloxazoline synthase MbtB n=1 Tax=Actinophytocola oryzae TaxID=502181 RepID=A0A4R7UY67_9PSEU|nr:non-ribosomal peptide synthetase [Actinophytocola oryzae]TDV41022.1 pyochelin synthetase [Actinophytocola oryzae]
MIYSANEPGDDDTFPLTEIQYAYWVGRGPNFVLGNVAPHAYFELEGRRLDEHVLTEAWNRIIARHGMLRAVVGADGNQRVLPEVPRFDIEVTDLSDTPADEVSGRLREIRDGMSHRVYDAAQWPLFDIRITRLAEWDRLHISLDLLMVDLASVAVLFSEWQTLCQNPAHELPPVDVTFRDYVLALERNADSERTRRALDYWTSRAATLAPPPDLPLDRSPVAVHRPRFTHREFQLDPDAWKRLRDRSEERGLTPTTVLATAFSEVLAAWSGTLRFTLNLTLFNRLPLLLDADGDGHRGLHPHLRRVVGDFTSICLLEVDTEEGTFDERVRRTQRQLQQDLRHRYVSALHTLRERRRLGLDNAFGTMPVVFTSGLGTVADVTGPRDYFGDITYRVSQTPQVWLDHQVVDITGSLDLTWDVVEELFPENLLDDMFATYTGLVEQLAADGAVWDGELRVTPPPYQLTERDVVNRTAGPLPDGLLHEPFLARVAEQPDRPAVITPAETLTYGELAGRANAVADAILRAGDGSPLRDGLVGVTLDKSADQVAAAYGVLLAGGAYLPAGARLPGPRRTAILTDGEAATVVTTAAMAEDFDWPEGMTPVPVDRLDDLAAAPAAVPAEPSDLAYVLFTSGSTGRPKGVMIEHRSALNTVHDITERFGVTRDDRVLGLAELSFDLSVYDLFGALGAGAAIVLPDPDQAGEPAHWADMMRRHGVTVWNSVPAQMQMLVDHVEAVGDIPDGLRLVMMSGDWVPVDLPDRIHALWPDAVVISMGGATEASIWSNYHRVDEVPPGTPSIPYGVPLRNQRFQVLDASMRPCPDWVPGELYIEGSGLARGYWRDPAKTAASFVQHPVTGVRLYRTGDYGRYLPGGIIQFLGRRDGQVKIRGHRIELGEIESVLTQHPGVDRAVAVKSDEDGGGARLLGFVVPAKDDTDSLYQKDVADPAESVRRWEALCDDREPAPGPSAETLAQAWRQLDDVYASAVAVALHTFGATDVPTILRSSGVARRYERWLNRAVAALRRRGELTDLPATIPTAVAAGTHQVLGESLGVPADLTDWLLTIAANLTGILTQDLHSAELYANDRTPAVYEHLFGPVHRVAARAVQRLAAAWPVDEPLRILEVGAGYGTLTRHVLPLLPERTEYTFTDISTYFTERAREQYADYPFVSYDLFDIDRPADLQGFDGKAFDIVIAGSMLHDAKQLRRSIRNLRSVLAPGGTLLLVEQTAFHDWFDLTMGLQQGFDGYEDTDLRSAHPLLDPGAWRDELAQAGFADTAVLTPPGSGMASVGFDVIVARGPDESRRFDGERLRTHLGQQLPRHMVPSTVHAIDELPLTSTGKVDRGTLAKARGRTGVKGRAAKPPRTDRQRKLVEIWCTVLGLSQADLGDDFLEAGGDSLLAARLVANISSAFGITVAVATVLEYPTVELLDGYLERILGPSELLPDALEATK